MDRSPGALESWQGRVALPETMGVEMVKIPAGSELELDLQIAAVEDGVYVSGTVSAPARAECARCLGEIAAPVQVRIEDLYAEPGSPAAEAAEEDDARLLEDGQVDLTQALIDAFGLSLGLAPTCESFAGVQCVQSDVPAPDGTAEEWQRPVDPRWAGLAEKFGRDPETGKER